MPRSWKYRDLIKLLRQHDPRFEVYKRRGKGSHRMIFHPDINGRPASFPVKYHGSGTEIRRGMISALARRFKLPKDLL